MIKKTFILTIAALTLSLAAFSQLGVKGGFALAHPIVDGNANTHFGFDLGVTYDVTENIRAEVLLEYLSRTEKTETFFGTLETKTAYTPITVGASYLFLTDNIQPYVGVNLGLYRISSKFGDNKASKGYFGFHPKAGVSFEVADNIFIDANVKYHLMFDDGDNTSLIGGNIGVMYIFDL